MIALKYILALTLLMGNLASTHLWATEITENPSETVALSPDTPNTSTTQTPESNFDLPNIMYTHTDSGFKIKFSGFTLDHVIDFTLNGDIITDTMTNLITKEEIIKVIGNDKGFEMDIALPMHLLQGQEFGVILNNGLKVSSDISAEDRSLFFVMRLTYVQLLQSLGYIFGW